MESMESLWRTATGANPSPEDYYGVDFWSNPERSGWLTKQGDYIKTWRRRWFVLKKGKLFWFKDPSAASTRSSVPRGVIPVGNCLTVKGAEDVINKPFAFEISTDRFTMYFIADNDKDKVTGELLDGLSSWDALRAALPVGTVSGAPKVKAMELIDELEVSRRGPYSGGFGGISFTGDMDIALALRTIVFPTGMRYNTMFSYENASKRREWVAHLQAGAGIVADSDPADEHRECENKAAGTARAIDLAESSFIEK